MVAIMRRAVVPSLILACVALHTEPVTAQAAPDSACSYSRCALRVDYGFLSTRLVRGSTGDRVARLGWFGSGVDILVAGSDSTAHHARQYQSRRRTGDALGFVGGVLTLAAFWTTDDTIDGSLLLISGITFELASLPFQLSARRSLDRSVWWYNRDLPRP
jgi:hypothetical protein